MERVGSEFTTGLIGQWVAAENGLGNGAQWNLQRVWRPAIGGNRHQAGSLGGSRDNDDMRLPQPLTQARMLQEEERLVFLNRAPKLLPNSLRRKGGTEEEKNFRASKTPFLSKSKALP